MGQIDEIIGDIVNLFKTLAPTIALLLTWIYVALVLVAIRPIPLNYFAAFIPVGIVFYLWRKEMLRREQPGFVHDRVREISLKDQEFALQWLIEQESKKLKSKAERTRG